MRILGIDPGFARMGFGVVDVESSTYHLRDFGHVSTAKEEAHPQRLHQIATDLLELCQRWKPNLCAIEKLFFSKNVKTALKVAEARGVILQTLTRAGYPVVEYAPNEVKLALTGDGRADKQQMQKMVTLLLRLKNPPQPDDAADALALALCHAHHSKFQTNAALS
jgi:crossover junction endodeoxyribonuclease RuvC